MDIRTSDQPILELGYGGHRCNWGVHIAGLYETPEERDEIILGFLCQGFSAGDLQLFPTPTGHGKQLHDRLRHRCGACAERLDDERYFAPRTVETLYYPNGTFSPAAMDEGLEAFWQTSQQDGQRNIRATADMSWALEAIPGVEGLMAYEANLNRFISDKPWVSICLYDLSRFKGRTVMEVLRTHPWTLSAGALVENPYYEDPDDWLRRQEKEAPRRPQ